MTRSKSANGVLDLSNAFDGMSSRAFIDWMHPSESGNERIARTLYTKLVQQLPERRRSTGTSR
jgi:hypothetical protein